jgi:NHLM bacteriocin system ABC transporter ATP-binding protein
MKMPPAPRQCQLIETGGMLESDGEETLRSSGQVVWMDVVEGNALWMGAYDKVVNAASGPLPLPRDLWLTAKGQVQVRGIEAADLLAEGKFLEAVALHQGFVLNWLASAVEQTVVEEQAKLEARVEQSLVLTREAFQKLLSVVTDSNDSKGSQTKRDSCMAACQAIGRQAAIEFHMPHAAEAATMDRDPIAAIAAASRVRYRRVALKGDWWTGDNGPLVASYAESGEWVALLPRRGGYDVYDPATDRTMPLTEAFSADLLPFAIMFYRVLPDRALRLRDLGVFVVHGRGHDLMQLLLMGLLGGLLGMATPIATGTLVDSLIPSADVSAVWQMVAALTAAAVAMALFEFTRSVTSLRIEGKMDSSLQAALWDRVLKLPVPFFRNYSAGDLALRINGVNTIRRALSRTTIGVVLNGLFSIFNLFLLFYYSPPLALVAALLVVVAMGLTLGIGFIKLRYERQLSEVGGRLSSLVFQYLTGIAKLRMGSAESRAFANWAEAFSRYRGLHFRAQHWGNIEHMILSGYTTLATAVLFAIIGMWLARGPESRLSAGEFIAFSAAFGTFFAGMVALAETLLNALNLVPVYERAKPILETIPESDEGKGHSGELLGGLEVANVSFQYGDGPEILKSVSLSVRPGGYVALVGPSGSGKSTLLRLLLGFEKPSSGAIYYDNQDLSTVDIQSVRRQLGVVLQNGQLIPGDIYTNIVGASTLTLEDAWEAARMVGLDEDINQMPMGMHTVIGEGSSTLSGGQRQRILIARAIVHRPRIIYFDEATSALDNRTQAIVTRSLEQLKVTRIVIAHRLSTIIHADQIIVLRDGKVEQMGNYETLVVQPGLFADLARRQMA